MIIGGMGEIGIHGTAAILNVGDGDTKLSFDPTRPEERARAAKIVAEMLRLGFSIMIEVDDGKGGKTFTRVKEFREDVCEYMISGGHDPDVAEVGQTQAAPAGKRKPARKLRSVPAESTRAVAVARSAGG